jgi:GDP-4-dehydro-6-deoxy-D-mannose reductase
MATTRLLVTGATGFVGRHLVELIRSSGGQAVFGTTRRATKGQSGRGDPTVGIPWFVGDLTDASFADSVVQDAKPDWVVHLAAQASVAESWQDPARTLINNVLAQLNLLEGIVRHAPRARVLVVGSAEEYGRPEQSELPAAESTPIRPDSPYGVSKVTQDYLGLQYHLGRGLDVVRVRPFNLFGPGQDDQFAVASFARQIAEAEAGLREPVISVGNLSVQRDYTDVRDAVRAYLSVLERGRSGEVYNVGGGGVHAMRDVLDALIRRAGRPVQVVVDAARFRPVDAPVISPDVTRIRLEVGWSARIPFDQTVEDVLQYWRARVAAGEAGAPL